MAITYSRTFLLQKLHQLTGIVPLGLFYFAHLFTNSKAMYGAESFDKAVGDLHGTPFLIFVEVFGIFLPLLFHSVYGVYISTRSRSNAFTYSYARNWFYVLQRVTGIFLFLFIVFHLLHYRFGLVRGLTDVAVAGNADQAFNIVAGDMMLPWVLFIYILGVAATAWHLAYGFWLFAVDWGLLIGERAQKYALYACMFIAVSLFGVGVNAAVSFVRPCGLIPAVLCDAPKHNKVSLPKEV